MGGSKGGHSRGLSGRATSVAQDILRRRRNKASKGRHEGSVKKVKKNTRYLFESAPEGYSFLPNGTGDLRKRCSELTQQRGLKMLTVMDDPVSTEARDPEKVSYHLRRCGYYVPSEVLEDACRELGYVQYDGKYMTAEASAAREQWRTIKRIMDRSGYEYNEPMPGDSETDDQIRSAITELFPDIPDEDREEIVKRAWVEGNVGTNDELSLPRRIQLATVARIRHAYTDYDKLLKAFGDRPYARREVERECMAKLSEWRGAHDNDDLHIELREMVHQVIVIDSSSEGDSDADDDDGGTSDSGHVSDSSLDGRSTRVVVPRPTGYDQYGRLVHAGNSHRSVLSSPLAFGATGQNTSTYGQIPASAQPLPVHGDFYEINGHLYQRETAPVTPVSPMVGHGHQRAHVASPLVTAQSYGRGAIESPNTRPLHDRSMAVGIGIADALQTRPIASIEPPEEPQRPPPTNTVYKFDGIRDTLPDRDRDQYGRPYVPQSYAQPRQAHATQATIGRMQQSDNIPYDPQHPEILTRPSQQDLARLGTTYRTAQSEFENTRNTTTQGYLRPQMPSHAIAAYAQPQSTASYQYQERPALLHAQPATIQYIPLPQPIPQQSAVSIYANPVQYSTRPAISTRPAQRIVYLEPVRPQYIQQPIHGQPALVQPSPMPSVQPQNRPPQDASRLPSVGGYPQPSPYNYPP